MRIGEFVRRTDISLKTARWLYDNMLNKDEREKKGTHRYFNEKDVSMIMMLKVENYPSNIKRIEEYTDYFITEDGKVFTNKRKFLEKIEGYVVGGYRYVTLWDEGKHENFKVSRLVAKYFVSNPLNKPVVNHIDGDKQNDVYVNLEWSTISENTQHAYDMGLAKNDKGEDDSQSIPVDLYKNNGCFIAHFGSMGEASRYTGKTKSFISRHTKNESYGRDGFCFRYSK